MLDFEWLLESLACRRRVDLLRLGVLLLNLGLLLASLWTSWES